MNYFILFVGGIALAACASTPSEPRAKGVAQYEGDARLGEQADRICFASGIDGFGETTRTTIIVDEGRDEYLLEMFGGCLNLERAQSIAFARPGGCVRKGDVIITSESVLNINDDAGFGPQRCTIKSIYKWDSKADVADADENEA